MTDLKKPAVFFLLGVVATAAFFIMTNGRGSGVKAPPPERAPIVFSEGTPLLFKEAVKKRAEAQAKLDEASKGYSGSRNPFGYLGKPEVRKYIEPSAAKGALLADFKKLIIYIPFYNLWTTDRSEKSLRPSTYKELPSPLQEEHFKKVMFDSLEGSFKKCLTTESGEKKSVEFIIGAHEGWNQEGMEDVYNPENLTLVLNIHYGYSPRKIGDDFVKDAGGQVLVDQGYGSFRYMLYRPYLPGFDGLRLTFEDNGFITFIPSDTEKEIQAKLQNIFERMSPFRCRQPASAPSGMTF